MNSLRKKTLAAIEQEGILLVYPIQNKKDPGSVWFKLFPRSEMRWEWDVDGDQRVSDLWLLKEELSRSGLVVYTKWYQNRATFFSKEVFVNMMAFMRTDAPLSSESTTILEALEMDSPLSTKQIKVAADLQGRYMEASYNRAMKALWQRLLVVAWGEVEDSSFPSLAVGATKNIFEDLWLKAQDISPEQARRYLEKRFPADNKFWKFAQKIQKSL